MKRECGVCWWIYDPELGDEDAGIGPGVAFEALPDDYACPRCGAAKARFVRPASDDDATVGAIVAAYRKVDARMRGLAIYNRQLAIEAVGFRRFDDVLAGALVTPWFISVIVCGKEVPTAGTVELALRGGRFQLHAAHEGVPHLALPLLSPVLEIADPAAARAVAAECLRLVFEGEAPKPPRAIGRRGLIDGLFGDRR